MGCIGMIESEEHVIRALKCRLNIDDSRWQYCWDCKYAGGVSDDFKNCHYDRLFRDCLELLEAKEVKRE